MIATPLLALLVACCLASPAIAAAQSAEVQSARKFVKEFYAGYVQRSLSESAKSPMEQELKRAPSRFAPTLLRALQADLLASSKSPDEIVGLDFDPFLNTQESFSHSSVVKVVRKGGSYFAGVALDKSNQPSVVAELERHQGNWRFVNFHYPDGPDLLSLLRSLSLDRKKSGAGKGG